MTQREPTSSVAVLDRPPGHIPTLAPIPVTRSLLSYEEGLTATADRETAGQETGTSFRTSGLVAIAAVAIYEGYLRLGAIPGGRTGLSTSVVGELLTVAVAVGLAVTGYLLTRPGVTRRRRNERLAMVAASALVVIGSLAAVSTGDRSADHLLGVALLVFAAASLGVAVIGGRSARDRSRSIRTRAVRARVH